MAEFVTVTLNPAIDVSATVERIAPFHKLRCTSALRDPGGGGINVARALQRWGSDVAAIYPAGGPTGKLLERLAAGEGIRSLAVETDGDTREDFTVFEEATRKQYRFVFPGAPLDKAGWEGCREALGRELPGARFLVGSGSLPPGAPTDAYARLSQMAKEKGARAVIDTSGLSLKHALEEGLYLIKPNLRELRELTAKKLTGDAERLQACRELVDSGKVEIVTLTLGKEGAIASTRERAWRARAPDIEPVSTVGAGDSFLAGMLWKLAAGEDAGRALQFAVAAGTAALLAPGTALCRPADVERLFDQVIVEDIDL